MIIVGLTGSIGMGKSTTAAMFADEGVPVFNTDAAVHDLYAPGGGAVTAIEAAFPGVSNPDGVDRAALAARVLGDAAALDRLEAIVHPLVDADRRAFLDRARAAGASLVLLDTPLLFETGVDALVDAVIVVSAPSEVQRRRVLQRPGMATEKLDAILARQISDDEKRARADVVIDTSQGLEAARAQVRAALAQLRERGA